MAVLDLQGLKAKSSSADDDKNTRGKSGSSKGCAPSGLSVILC